MCINQPVFGMRHTVVYFGKRLEILSASELQWYIMCLTGLDFLLHLLELLRLDVNFDDGREIIRYTAKFLEKYNLKL